MLIVGVVSQTCCACPNAYSGKTTDDQTVFARYRWGHLSVRLQPAGVDDGLDGAAGQSILEVDFGGQYDGMLEYSDLRALTRDLIHWPETCS